MKDTSRKPGWDKRAVNDIAKRHYGSLEAMFKAHDWSTDGKTFGQIAPTRVVETYGSVREFEAYIQRIKQSRADAKDIWSDETSVLFTSFWGWTPETWGTVGWSGDRGRARRTNLLGQLSDPFICVCYVTSNQTETDPDLKGMMAGFYLVSHEAGDRDKFTHPIHHQREPTKWRHSLRALRAFSFLPEYRPQALAVFPELSRSARHVSAMGEIVTDLRKIDQMRSIPWSEVPVYSAGLEGAETLEIEEPSKGMVRAGPANEGGYFVPDGTKNLPRELYVLRLAGDTSAYLGESIEGASIFKIGLSISPDSRRQSLQKMMPRGRFQWELFATTRKNGHDPYSSFSAAVAGEDAMKQHLARHAEWLGGEFYLATEAEIKRAWQRGHEEALKREKAPK